MLESDTSIPAFCEWWGRLSCELAIERAPLRVDAEHCPRTETKTCLETLARRIAPSLAAGRIVYHAELRERAAQDLRADPLSFREREAMRSFRSLFEGRVPNSGKCEPLDVYGFYVNECSDGFCTDESGGGTCRPYPGPGDACDFSEQRCAPWASCTDDGCVERPALGGACDPEADTCLPPARCLLGGCDYPSRLGGFCSRTSECVEGACVDGHCELSPADTPCAAASECEADLSCIDGVCAPRGTPSASSASYSCWIDRDCIATEACLHVEFGAFCGAPPRLGSSCGPCPGCQSCPMGLVCTTTPGSPGTCSVPP